LRRVTALSRRASRRANNCKNHMQTHTQDLLHPRTTMLPTLPDPNA
jgi:hypothetical protein